VRRDGRRSGYEPGSRSNKKKKRTKSMRIKLSKSDWREIGVKMGWIKTAFDPRRGEPGRAEPEGRREFKQRTGKDSVNPNSNFKKAINELEILVDSFNKETRHKSLLEAFTEEEKQKMHQIEKLSAWIRGTSRTGNPYWTPYFYNHSEFIEKMSEYEKIFKEAFWTRTESGRITGDPGTTEKRLQLALGPHEKLNQVSTSKRPKRPFDSGRQLRLQTPYAEGKIQDEIAKFKVEFQEINGRKPDEEEIRNYVRITFKREI
jgi:hypothetical protein